MIYILPTRHDIQLGLSASPKKLITHISNLIKEHSIDFVTEEVHPDELIGDSISPIGRFTFEKDVSYTYLDPSIREESEISMPTPQQVISEPDETKKKEMQLIRARKGEDFWLPRIIAINESYSNI
ncbi:MAG: hypothetical protein ACREHC_02610, partial [Candidatus Levyibacteriota bacterium]